MLPTFIMVRMPLVMQILFFGALLSAIKSTSSATLLAPSTSFVENILKQIRPGMSDRRQLVAMRITMVIFALVLAYAIAMQGTPIYELVLFGLPGDPGRCLRALVFGLYWSRGHHAGRHLLDLCRRRWSGCWLLFPQVTTWARFPRATGRPAGRAGWAWWPVR